MLAERDTTEAFKQIHDTLVGGNGPERKLSFRLSTDLDKSWTASLEVKESVLVGNVHSKCILSESCSNVTLYLAVKGVIKNALAFAKENNLIRK